MPHIYFPTKYAPKVTSQQLQETEEGRESSLGVSGRARRGVSAPLLNIPKAIRANGLSMELSHVYEDDEKEEDGMDSMPSLANATALSQSMSKLNLVVKDDVLTVQVHPS